MKVQFHIVLNRLWFGARKYACGPEYNSSHQIFFYELFFRTNLQQLTLEVHAL